MLENFLNQVVKESLDKFMEHFSTPCKTKNFT